MRHFVDRETGDSSAALQPTRRTVLKLAALAGIGAGTAGGFSTTVAAQPAPFPTDPTQKLLASDGAQDDGFGTTVAIDDAGERLLVGAPGADGSAGKAYVFDRTGGSWSESTVLSPSSSDDELGAAVALSADGDTAVIGAPGAGASDQGLTSVYTFDGTSWSTAATLTASDAASGDRFGDAVAVDAAGTVLLVGAGDASPDGAAYVFADDGAGWTQEARLTAPSNPKFERIAGFGRAVALDASGTAAMVGAPGSDFGGLSHGGIFAFEFDGSSWSSVAADNELGTGDDHALGSALDFDEAGDHTLVGAPGTGPDVAGFASRLSRGTGGWTESQDFRPADRELVDQFGWSVALGSTGDLAVIGSRLDDVDAVANQGSVYVFVDDGGWGLEQRLLADDGAADDRFGSAVALDGADAVLAVGAANESERAPGAGAVYVFGGGTVSITIDVKPNKINPRSKGKVPVLVEHTSEFDPTDPATGLEVGSLRFGAPDVVDGGGGARPAHGGHVDDVDDDGDDDLLVHFPTADAGFERGDSTAKLVGTTHDGRTVVGVDDIELVGRP